VPQTNPQEEEMIKLPIVGARFRPPAEDVLRLLPAGTELILRRQPENPHDGNAVQVLLPGSHDLEEIWKIIQSELGEDFNDDLHLGFIPRADQKLPMDAARLAPLMDANADASDERGFFAIDIKGTLTFGPTGNPMIAFEEPKE
jgi:hypothetical protein